MSRRALAAVLAAALLLLTACGPAAPAEESGPPPSEELSETPAPSPEPTAPEPLALAWDPEDTLEPLRAGTVNQTLSPLVFEGLFALDAAFNPEPVLCLSYSRTNNDMSWTFLLQEGVTFSDGTPLTAEIVARCLNAARNSDQYRARLSSVAAVRAGEGSVTLELSRACGNLPVLLDVPIFLTREEGYPLGTGPYCFAEEGGELCLSAVDRWWQGKQLPTGQFLLRQTPTADDRIAAFDTGRVTLTDTDFSATNALGYSTGYDVWDYYTSALVYVGFNLQKSPCNSTNVRLAAARCLDRENIAATVFAGHADGACLPVHPVTELYDASLAQALAYDPEAAAALLGGDGWTADGEGKLVKNGQRLELSLVVNSENAARSALADTLAAELEALGATVTVRRLTWENYQKALNQGDFDLYIAQVKLTADFDPTALLTGELNYGGIYDGEMNAVLASFRASVGTARVWLAYSLYARLTLNVPIAPVCFTRGTVLTRWGRLFGLSPVQGNLFHGLEDWVVA